MNKIKKGVGGNRVVKRENFLIVAFTRFKAVFNEILLGFKWAEENRHKSGWGKL
jgi:hypothetical protein